MGERRPFRPPIGAPSPHDRGGTRKLLENAARRHHAGDLDGAAALYRQALAIDPDQPDALHLLGVVASQQGAHERALELITRAVSLRRDAGAFHASLGQVLARLGRTRDAEAAYREALRLEPARYDVRFRLGNLLRERGENAAAESCYREVLAARPEDAQARVNLGVTLRAQGRIDEAIAEYRAALAREPALALAHCNLGNALSAKHDLPGAIAAYREAVRIDPDQADAHLNLALALLTAGEFEEGWREYEWRWRSAAALKWNALGALREPAWDGGEIAGRRLLVRCEQGLGDAMQFARYLEAVAARGASVIVECQPELARLLASCPGVAGIVERGNPLPPFDAHCPLLSLPRLLGAASAPIACRVPYLRADAATRARWRERVDAGPPGLRVGLAWAGVAGHGNDRNRSLPLAAFAPLARVPGVVFYSLQKGPAAAQCADPPAAMRMIDLTSDLTDFADTAGLLGELDLVISVDTAVAHLAGALARPVWTLIPHVPDWRWQLGREDSPWYPTMRLLRQASPEDWSAPIARAATMLEALSRPSEAQATPGFDGARAPLSQAFERYQRGEHAAAEELATRAVATAPTSPDLLGLLAALSLARKDFVAGETWARQGLRHAPHSARLSLSLGYALRHEGRLTEALDAYRRAVCLEPDFAEGWHRLGQALRAAGEHAQAHAAVERALAIEPGYAAAWITSGHILADQNRHEAALTAYREAAARDAASAEARVGLGTALQALGRYEEAIASHGEALRLRPDLPEAHNNLGNALKAAGRIEEALLHYEEALRARPAYHEALLNRGLALQECGRHEEAIPSFEAAIAARPGNALAHMALGTAWQDRGRLEDAERCYREALRLNPAYPEALSNLGVALQELSRLDEALACHERALELKPGDPDVLVNYGVALKECGRLEDAIARYEQALRVRPGFEGGLINLGAALNEQGRLPEALDAYHRAVAENPGSPEAHWNHSLALLLKGDYERGWREYEWRWQSETARRARVKKPSFPEPEWDGGELPGERRILLVAEQGYGDAIQFARYVPLLARRGARVTVQCHRELLRLMHGLDGVARVIPLGATPPPFDTWLPMLSLPLALRTRVESIPADVPYLKVESDKLERWRTLLAADPACLKVGIVWAGRAEHRNDRNRSVRLAQFAPLARVGNVSFYSLQKGPPAAEAAHPPPGMRLHDVSGMLEDFADTAALVSLLDLVITVDTAVLHLAGALGRPVWALIAFAPDWRWFLEREDSPWYPTVRLFRQPRPRDWAPVVERMAGALAPLAATRATAAVATAAPPPSLALGIASHRAGRLDEAETVYRELLAREPRHADALHLSGVIATQRGGNAEAEQLIRRAIEVNPRAPEYWNSLGNVLRQLERAGEAEQAYREAIRLKPEYAEAHNNLGLLLKSRADLEGALAAIREALRLQPAYAEGHVNLGNTLQALERYEESLASYAEALRLRPHYPEALMNLGNALQRLGRLTEAIARTRQALEQRPHYADAHMNLGHALQSQGRLSDALSCYRAALSMRPDYPEAHWNYSLALLLSGDLREGFREYEWRWRWKDFPSPPREFTQPVWRGEDIAGSVILLHAEQVFGDTIQFIRYAPLVAERGAEVVVECQPELVRLFSTVPGIRSIVPRGARLPSFDRHCPLLSLPLAFGHDLDTLPRTVPYLAADSERVAAWRARLGGGIHVGIAWAGSPHHKNDHNRSLALAAFSPLAQVPGISFVSLQKGGPARQAACPPAGMRLIDPTAELGDFADTAALVASLDLVICVDTAVAHLAGALGVSVWILLPAAPDWRWLLEREDSPWYPTARLFRQRDWGDWDAVLERVARALAERAGEPLAPATAPSAQALLKQAALGHQAGDYHAAIPVYRRVLALDPECADAWHLLGVALRQSKQHREAAACIGRALRLRPGVASYHASLGNVFKDESRYEEAASSYREALRLKPDYAEAHHNLGTTLHHLKRRAEAEQHFREATRHNPALAEAWYNLGNLLQDRDALDEAQACYERAIELAPSDARAHSNLGTIHIQRGAARAAIRAFEAAIAADAGNPDAHWNLSLALLLTGDFPRGWREYEWRWRTADGRRLERRFPRPRYAGEDPRGQRVLLHAEQGLGDAIQFARYAALLAARGATVLLESRPETARLLASATGVAQVLVAGSPLPEFDLHCPLLSLPGALGTTLDSLPAEVPYLHADPELSSEWRERVRPHGGLRVGLAWAGRPEHPHDRWRSIPFSLLAPLLEVPGIAWHSLQKSSSSGDKRLIDNTQLLGDFADTAALVANLDLVIAVDTSVAHLAGALGKPVWVLLHHAPDWRWLLDREDSVWYPTMTLIRQARAGDWADVIARTTARLIQYRDRASRGQ